MNINRDTLYEYLKRPDFPAETKDGWPVDEVAAFIVANTSKETVAASLSSDVATLKKVKLHEEGRKLKIANDTKEGALIPRADHEAIISEMATECQKVLGSLPAQLAPLVVGATVADAERLIQDGVDEAVAKLHNG